MSEDSSRQSGAVQKSGSSPHSQTTKPPQYKRFKRKGRADSAVCYVNGKRVLLGVYGSPESKQKFAELVGESTGVESEEGASRCVPPQIQPSTSC